MINEKIIPKGTKIKLKSEKRLTDFGLETFPFFDQDMFDYSDKYLTIDRCEIHKDNYNVYRIVEDEGEWMWAAWMFDIPTLENNLEIE